MNLELHPIEIRYFTIYRRGTPATPRRWLNWVQAESVDAARELYAARSGYAGSDLVVVKGRRDP
jgi:hypothetical protein